MQKCPALYQLRPPKNDVAQETKQICKNLKTFYKHRSISRTCHLRLKWSRTVITSTRDQESEGPTSSSIIQTTPNAHGWLRSPHAQQEMYSASASSYSKRKLRLPPQFTTFRGTASSRAQSVHSAE